MRAPSGRVGSRHGCCVPWPHGSEVPGRGATALPGAPRRARRWAGRRCHAQNAGQRPPRDRPTPARRSSAAARRTSVRPGFGALGRCGRPSGHPAGPRLRSPPAPCLRPRSTGTDRPDHKASRRCPRRSRPHRRARVRRPRGRPRAPAGRDRRRRPATRWAWAGRPASGSSTIARAPIADRAWLAAGDRRGTNRIRRPVAAGSPPRGVPTRADCRRPPQRRTAAGPGPAGARPPSLRRRANWDRSPKLATGGGRRPTVRAKDPRQSPADAWPARRAPSPASPRAR